MSRRTILKGAAVAGVAVPNVGMLADLVGAAQTPISVENGQTGALPTEWRSDYDQSIVGYTPDLSVLPGQTVRFKVKTDSTNYRIRIYRLGYYGGRGARRFTDLTPTLQTQPAPDVNSTTRLVDCGKWKVNATWTVPTNAVSGIYYALFDRLDGGGTNHTLFVVRSNSAADILVQTSDATWHAYNMYGGASLYFGKPEAPFNGQKATKVSYNRPLSDISEKESEFFGTEYALVRFLERNGYSVNYCTQLDTHTDAAMLRRHKIFISSGHDEYWTGPQRANVTAARDAKVNLIFFSGNEVFWRTRMEPSIDGTNTANRTLVCYKETLDDRKSDPTSEWTGTWRDPRFTPPGVGGGQPENALTGQLFRAINPVNAPDFELEVPSEYSKLRFWRNTDVAALTPGNKVVLAESTLGYEWDEIVDNGYQPAGTIKMSRTTATANEVLIDNGATYVRAAMTHHLSLYRAASGALVFGAGTVQWAYGLDENHRSDEGTDTDRNIQQATVNLLADMGAQPATLMSELKSASPSNDTLPPTSTITGPAAGTTFNLGKSTVITGTAVDSGGGVVAAVEVSTDNGVTWHPADGTSSWSYVFAPAAMGPITVRVRATDDSCNTQTATTSRAYTVGQRALPAPLFPDGLMPAGASVNDPDPVTVGVRLQPLENGFLTGVRFYKGAENTGTHVAQVWSATGQELARGTFINETATGWQTVAVPPVAVSAGTDYVVSVHMPNGRYAATDRFFEQPYELWPLRAPANGEGGMNGVFAYGSTPKFPNEMWGATNYWVDAVFNTAGATNPLVTSTSPGAGLQSVAVTATVSATFNKPMNASSIVFELKNAQNVTVAGTTAYSAETRTITFTPSVPLTTTTQYTARVVSANDSGGAPLQTPFVWNFTTVAATPAGMVSLWDDSATPAAISNETDPLELGTRFTTSVDGLVTALQFYKAPGSPGPHIGHLWDDTGALIATAAYTAETASGWQQVNLPTPVQIYKNRSYIVSYYSPAGIYPLTTGYFTSNARVSGVLTAPRSTSGAGNGLFRYGPVAVPNGSWNASNYWADLMFSPVELGSAPVVTDVTPSPDLVGVVSNGTVKAVFDSAINAAQLEFVLRTPAGTVVNSTVTYDEASRTATLTPNGALAAATTYAVSVSAKSVSGVAMASPKLWSFTTASAPGASPAVLWTTAAAPVEAAADDADPVEVGTRFTVARDGLLTAIRFYKGPGNNGPHIGRIWSMDQTVLGTASFPNETASGWQQGALSTPVPVTAGSTYVVSYHAPAGRYAVTYGLFTGTAINADPLQAPATTGAAGNGVFAYGSGGFPSQSYNGCGYFVDAVFVDLAAPKVVGTTPQAGAVDVASNTAISAVFSKAISPPTLVFEVRDGGGALVGGNVAYNATTRTATFTPGSALVGGASYTVSVKASDTQGNAMAAPTVWSFTVLAPVVQPTLLTLWPDTAVPAVASSNESDPVELGLRIRTDVRGKIHGVRFWKGPGNTGTHVASLWGPTGARMAQATFQNETESGWQTVLFAQPVEILPGQTYVASYHLPNGNYPYDTRYFVNREVSNGPLRSPADGAFGGNGLFRYGGGGSVPTQTWEGGHYWVDVIYSAG